MDICYCYKLQSTALPTELSRGYENLVKMSNIFQTLCITDYQSWAPMSGWPSGLRRCVQVAVLFWGRGFESHFWQNIFLLFYYLSTIHYICLVPLAQRIARWTSNPKVLGSIPRWDDTFCNIFFVIRVLLLNRITYSYCFGNNSQCQDGRVV